MSFKFIAELVMMVGLGGALYVIARTLPRIDDADTKPQNPLAPSWLIEYFEKGDEWLVSFFEKALHKLRVNLMRMDNAMLKRIRKIKQNEAREVGFPVEEKKEESAPLEKTE